jgi:hypothetical protein
MMLLYFSFVSLMSAWFFVLFRMSLLHIYKTQPRRLERDLDEFVYILAFITCILLHDVIPSCVYIYLIFAYYQTKATIS